MDRTTVLRALDSLSERGLVARSRRNDEGVFASTAYFLHTGVGAESDNVVAQRDNPLGAESDNGSCTERQGVGAESDINQEVKPGREPKEENSSEKRPKLTVMKRSPKAENPPQSEIPSGMPVEPWIDFVAMRKERGKPLTVTAAKLLTRKIETLRAEGHDPALLLNKATEHQWLTVYPGDDTKAPPRKVEYVELSPEEAAAQWERDFGRTACV
jgi:hypothetical protein